MHVSELIRFKNDLDLGPEAFAEMTGVSFGRIRRGRVSGEVALSPEQVAVIGRARRLLELALGLCGNREAALEWIYAPAPSLGKRAPIDLTITDIAFGRVERLIDTLKNATLASASAPASREPLPPLAVVAKEEIKVARQPVLAVAEAVVTNPPAATSPAVQPVVPATTLTKQESEPKPDEKFRIAEHFKEARARRPELTKAELARRMVAAGFAACTSAKFGRYEIGYEASWREITALASILGVKPQWLAQSERVT
jgi:hypothetical protein